MYSYIFAACGGSRLLWIAARSLFFLYLGFYEKRVVEILTKIIYNL